MPFSRLGDMVGASQPHHLGVNGRSIKCVEAVDCERKKSVPWGDDVSKGREFPKSANDLHIACIDRPNATYAHFTAVDVSLAVAVNAACMLFQKTHHLPAGCSEAIFSSGFEGFRAVEDDRVDKTGDRQHTAYDGTCSTG